MAKRMREKPKKTKAQKEKPIKAKKKMSRKKLAAIIVSIVLVVGLAIGVGIYALLHMRINPDGVLPDEGKTQPPSVGETTKSINFLVVGIDSDQTRQQALTDTMMVVSLDLEKKQANILQIPRDTFVGETYAPSTGKFNEIYNRNYGGNGKIQGLAKAINEQFGVPIDHYITITMDAFVRAVDAMGGIEVDLPYSISDGKGYLPAGLQRLSGKQAQWFVRHRASYAEGDIGRVKAQRIFMSALMKEALNSSLTELASIATNCYSEVSTDLQIKDIISLIGKVKEIDPDDIYVAMVPGQSTTQPWGSQSLSYWSAHKAATLEIVNEYMRPYQDPITLEDMACLELLNSTDYNDDNGQTIGDIAS